MTDVLSGGPPDQPSRRRPKVAISVVVAALAVGAALGQQVWQRGSPVALPSASGPPSASTGPAQAVPTSAPGELRVEPRLAGVSAAVTGDVRLVVGGPRPVGLGAGAPRLSGLPVPPGWEVTRVLPMPAGLLVVVERTQLSDTQASSKVYLVGPTGHAAFLADADQAVAGVGGTSVVVVRAGSTGPGSPANPPGVLSTISLSGRVVNQHPVAADFGLLADTAAGLLVTVAPSAQGSQLQVVDRATLAVRQHLGRVGYVVAASSTRAAWVPPGCADTCRLVVADLTSGVRHTVELAPDYQVGAVAFSPDGRHVAVSYYGRHPQQAGGAAPGLVDVVDLAGGQRRRLPGVATGIKQAADLAWTPDGRWLAVAVGWPDPGFRRIGLWPVGGGPVHLVPGRIAGGYLSGALLAV